MDRGWWFRLVLVLGALGLSAYLLYPSYVFYTQATPEQREKNDLFCKSLPSWAPCKKVNLGLDLQGGLHLVMGVEVDKASQRADWTVRPLPAHLVAYARGDTRHLLEIASRLAAELAAVGRSAAAAEEFTVVEARSTKGERFPADGWASEPVARRMTPRERGALRALWEWRDRESRRRDVPPFRVMQTEVLIALAEKRPTSPAALGKIRGLSDRLAGPRAAELVAVIDGAPPAELPRREAEEARAGLVTAEQKERFERLRRWRIDAAARRKMDPGLLIPNGLLKNIARAAPDSIGALGAVPEVRRWQVEDLGAEILLALGDKK